MGDAKKSNNVLVIITSKFKTAVSVISRQSKLSDNTVSHLTNYPLIKHLYNSVKTL